MGLNFPSQAGRIPIGGVPIATQALDRAPQSAAADGGPMSTKNDYSAEEWKAISGAPVAAGLVITWSDGNGSVGTAKEALAVGKAITDSARGEAPEIVKTLAQAVK